METTQVGSQSALVSGLTLARADRAAYAALAGYHYCNGSLPPVAGIWALYDRTSPLEKPVLAGVIVYSFAPKNCAARRAAVGTALDGKRQSERLAWLNRNVRRIARVITAPAYRGQGVATRLVRETLPLVGAPVVEAIASHHSGCSFFEKAGMCAAAVEWDATQCAALSALREAGLLNNSQPRDVATVTDIVARLPSDQQEALAKVLARYLSRFHRRRICRFATLAEKAAFTMRYLAEPKRYYYWIAPTGWAERLEVGNPAGGLAATGRECL